MSKKAIVLLRVSTQRQEIESQRRDLIQLAKADGYSEGGLIFVEGVGASAIKMNDLYMREIQQLYRTIESDREINAVYAWEISRIGRNESKLFEIKNFLIQHRVQLVIHKPSLRLLNPDGSVNAGIELAFSLFATLSKQEMELRMERFARGKARNKAEGKYNGGRIKLGYRLTRDKYFEIHPENAAVVRTMFARYAGGECSVAGLHRELVQLGIYSRPSAGYNGIKQINAILKDRAYIGEGLYPRIVSDEVFEAVQAKFASRPKRKPAGNIFFCGGLLKDKESGYTFVPDGRTTIYTLNQVRPRMQMSINYLDFACWYTAMYLKNTSLPEELERNRREYERKVEENALRAGNLRKQEEDLRRQIDRAIEMNIRLPEHFPEEKMRSVIQRCEREITGIGEEIAVLETESAKIRAILEDRDRESRLSPRDAITDPMKREIILSVIDHIEVERIEQRHYRLRFVNKVGLLDGTYWEYDSRKCGASGARLHMHNPDGSVLDMTEIARMEPRFIRTKK